MRQANLNSILPQLISASIPAPLESALEQALGIREIREVYSKIRNAGEEIAGRLLQFLEVRHRVAGQDLDQIPSKGPTVVVMNHPFGILEAAILATLLRRIRPDVKFLANRILTAIPELASLIIPVDTNGPSNAGAVRQAIRALEQGALLVIFPAGEVSHFHWTQLRVTDPQWTPSVSTLLELAARRAPGLRVVPAYTAGANSAIFHLLGILHPRLRTALLARELLNKRGADVEIRIGSPIAVKKLLAIPSAEDRVTYLRWRTYLLAERKSYKPRTALPLVRNTTAKQDTIAQGASREELAGEIESLSPESLLAHAGDLQAYLANAGEIPATLAEIARLREITFRAVGEGSGNARDLDEFDLHYLHLFVWNSQAQEVVGAYRLRATDQAAISGLYTAQLFGYKEPFLHKLGPALELGRSFIRPEYQRSFAPLLLLWKGIGKYVARHPRYKTLFGAVSISNQYRSISRSLMVSFLQKHALLGDWASLLSPPRRFAPEVAGRWQAGDAVEDLSDVVSDLEPDRTGVPVLLRQYLRLGGKLLGFSVDKNFSNALDGLILVDLTQTEPKLLEHYLGKRETAQFLAFHKGELWNTRKAS